MKLEDTPVRLPGHKIVAPVARQPGGPAKRSRAECVMILASVVLPMPLLMLQEMSLGHHRVGRQPPACPQQPRPGVSSESPGYPAWLFHPGYSCPCRSSIPLPPPLAAPPVQQSREQVTDRAGVPSDQARMEALERGSLPKFPPSPLVEIQNVSWDKLATLALEFPLGG